MIAENFKGEKEKEVLTDEELFGELSTFFFAGTDTTAVLFEMMVYLLAENPEV
jgi:cytochrome P450